MEKFTEKQLLSMSRSEIVTRFLELQDKVQKSDNHNFNKIKRMEKAGAVANENRKKESISKIKSAISFLKISGEKVSVKTISEYSKISVVTVRKYRIELDY